eukprot:7388460-Prymnesium_polylepis.2
MGSQRGPSTAHAPRHGEAVELYSRSTALQLYILYILYTLQHSAQSLSGLLQYRRPNTTSRRASPAPPSSTTVAVASATDTAGATAAHAATPTQ